MLTIGSRIRIRREELNLSQDELGRRIGYKSRSSINKIELDQRNLTQSKIKAIADALETTPSYIMGWESSTVTQATKEDVLELTNGVKIPVLGDVAAGQPIFAHENYIGFEEIPEGLSKTGKFFALRIKGDSMSPRIVEGDVVIVRQQEDAESGDVVIVLINGEAATCKRLMKYAEGISLISFNPAYTPMVFSNKEITEKPVKILGKVIENRQKY